MKKSFYIFIGLISLSALSFAGDITDVQCVALKQKIEDLRCEFRVGDSNPSESCTENDEKKIKAMKLFEKHACYDRIYKLIDQQLEEPVAPPAVKTAPSIQRNKK